VRAAVPAQSTLRSDADALALAVHAALEVDGAPPSCARLFRSRRPVVRWCPVPGHPHALGFLCAAACVFNVCARLRTGLRCVASSEEAAKASRGEPPASPLPADWNDGGDVYCLYYKHAAGPGALFTVKSVVMDELLLVGCAPAPAPAAHPPAARARLRY
jgi:hypothetical protein